jgi:hypothetical protein
LDEGKAPFDISKDRSERLPVSNLLDENTPLKERVDRDTTAAGCLKLLNCPAERAKIPKG